jgi:hypothetical protein
MSLSVLPDYEIYRQAGSPIDPGVPEEDQNYIDADRFNMLDFRGRYLFIKDRDHLKLIEISDFQIQGLNRAVIKLIQFRTECYNVTKDLYIDESVIRDLASWYSKARKHHSLLALNENPDTNLQLAIARYYMVPEDLYHHFRNFDPLNELSERYERSQAIEALLDYNVAGTWLIRHSSYNRPKNPNTLADIIKFGIRYYVLSYSMYRQETMIIKHILITFNVAMGWSYDVEGAVIFPNFLNCLEDILEKHHLQFTNLHSDYYHS